MSHEDILHHAEFPRFFELLEHPDVDYACTNPLCGDVLRLTLRIENGQIIDLGWWGRGCVLSQAMASLLGEQIIGLTLERAGAITSDQLIAQFDTSPVRLRCALLCLQTLQGAIHSTY